jgi:hypothetical protein
MNWQRCRSLELERDSSLDETERTGEIGGEESFLPEKPLPTYNTQKNSNKEQKRLFFCFLYRT